jgi:actin-like ATPase involved in cell morphogenesis
VVYRLGVDLGTTYTAAAVNVEGRLEMLALGNRALQMPSVLFIKEDGEVLVGEAAERRGVVEPTRVVREFKRRIGDSVPLVVGGAPYSAQALAARLLSWVVGVATERQGGAPGRVTVTYPASWGPFKYDLLQQAIALAGLRNVATCTEPEAAAITYASRSWVGEGERLAVYDLGGGTFDAAVLTRDREGFRLLGSPEGIEHLGGIDFDAAVFQHVLTSLGNAAKGLDDRDEAMVVGLTRLRRDCVEAKEALSADVETTIPVVLPGVNTSVRVTRGEFEDMLRPAIGDTVSAMQRVLSSADTQPQDLSAIVLVGGSSRIPLVSEQLSAAFGRPLALDTHPKHDIALGAAIRGAPAPTGPTPAAAPIATVPPAVSVTLDRSAGRSAGGSRPGSGSATGRLPPLPATMPVGVGGRLPTAGRKGPPSSGTAGRRGPVGRFGSGRTPWLAAGAVVAVVLVAAAVMLLTKNRTNGGAGAYASLLTHLPEGERAGCRQSERGESAIASAICTAGRYDLYDSATTARRHVLGHSTSGACRIAPPTRDAEYAHTLSQARPPRSGWVTCLVRTLDADHVSLRVSWSVDALPVVGTFVATTTPDSIPNAYYNLLRTAELLWAQLS